MTQIKKTVPVLAVLALVACSDRSQDPLDPLPSPQEDASIEDAEAEEAKPDTLAQMCGFDELHAGVAFKAPKPRGEGFLAYSASVDYPEMANKADLVPGLNPFPGCLAAFSADQELDCDFGAAYQGTKVVFNVGLSDGSYTGSAGHYFSTMSGDKTVTIGTYAACVGDELVGSCKDDECEGVLAKDQTGNLAYTVPEI